MTPKEAPKLANTRMAEVARAVALVPGIDSDLVPGPFDRSDMQLLVKLPGGQHASVMPDIDTATLYEVVHTRTSGDVLFDKLTVDGVCQRIRAIVNSIGGGT